MAKTQAENQIKNPYAAPQSEVSLTNENTGYTGAVYNPLGIAIATVFGSVLAAGLLLQSNFLKFKQRLAATLTILVTIISTLSILVFLLLSQNASLLFYVLVNFIAAILVMPCTFLIQGKALEQHEEAGYRFHSYLRAVLMGIGCFLAINVIFGLALTLLSMVSVRY